MKPIKRSDIKTVPILRDDPAVPSGMSIWAVVMYLKQFNWDGDKVVDLMEGALAESDIEFAKRFYEKHHDEIEFRLRQISGTAYSDSDL